ncbi:hypothetical protein GPALN_009744 [Globodera pallida]|nr:hypothetical protein GPALN_009744 [Globodera pallida]
MSITKSTGRTPNLDKLNPIQLIRILLSPSLITLYDLNQIQLIRTKILLKMRENGPRKPHFATRPNWQLAGGTHLRRGVGGRGSGPPGCPSPPTAPEPRHHTAANDLHGAGKHHLTVPAHLAPVPAFEPPGQPTAGKEMGLGRTLTRGPLADQTTPAASAQTVAEPTIHGQRAPRGRGNNNRTGGGDRAPKFRPNFHFTPPGNGGGIIGAAIAGSPPPAVRRLWGTEEGSHSPGADKEGQQLAIRGGAERLRQHPSPGGEGVHSSVSTSPTTIHHNIHPTVVIPSPARGVERSAMGNWPQAGAGRVRSATPPAVRLRRSHPEHEQAVDRYVELILGPAKLAFRQLEAGRTGGTLRGIGRRRMAVSARPHGKFGPELPWRTFTASGDAPSNGPTGPACKKLLGSRARSSTGRLARSRSGATCSDSSRCSPSHAAQCCPGPYPSPAGQPKFFASYHQTERLLDRPMASGALSAPRRRPTTKPGGEGRPGDGQPSIPPHPFLSTSGILIQLADLEEEDWELDEAACGQPGTSQMPRIPEDLAQREAERYVVIDEDDGAIPSIHFTFAF